MNFTKDNQNTENKALLPERLARLPYYFFLEMREGFYNLKSNSTWSRFMNGIQDLKLNELQYLSKFIGCTLDDLLNPDFDLLDHYIDQQNEISAKAFGLVKPESHVA